MIKLKEIRNLNSLNVDQESYESKKQPPQVFCKKRVLRNFANFVGKHRCFPMNFTKFLTKSFLQNTAGRLLLETFLVHLLSEKIPSEIRSVLASKFGKEVWALKFLQEILEISVLQFRPKTAKINIMKKRLIQPAVFIIKVKCFYVFCKSNNHSYNRCDKVTDKNTRKVILKKKGVSFYVYQWDTS